MAIVSTDPGGDGTSIITVHLGLTDVFGEKRNKVFSLDDAVTGSQLDTFLGHQETISNFAVYSANYALLRQITGSRASPVNALQSSLSERLYLTFAQTSPINPAKELVRQYVLPAYTDATIRTGARTPVWTQTDLAAMITFLQTHLATRLASTGGLVIGGWTLDTARSGFGSQFAKYDGQPG